MGFPFDEDDDGSDSGDESLNYNPRKSIGVNLSDLSFDDPFTLANLPAGSGLFDIEGNLNLENTLSLINDRDLFTEFAKLFPDDAALLSDIALPTEQGFKEYVSKDSSGLTEPPERTGAEGAGFPGEGIKSGVKEWDDAAKKAGVELTAPPDNKSLLDKGKDLIKNLTGLDDKTINELGKYGLLAGIAKLAYDDAEKARQRARGWIAPGGAAKRSIVGPKGHVGYTKAAQGGVMSLAGGGDVRQPFYLGGSTDGMTDEVPAHIDGKRPAALSDGEFVIPADVVSHLGNGNSNAGAQRLYEMMDQVRQARTGTTKQGKQINPEDFTKGVASFAGGGEVMDFRKLTPEEARQAWVEYGRTGEDPSGLAFDMMVGGKAANSLVNTGINQLVNKNKQLRAADPTGYDVGNIISNIVHKDFNKSQGTSSSLLPAHQQLQSYQKGMGLTDQQMIDAMSKSPLRSGSTYSQNLNLLLDPLKP